MGASLRDVHGSSVTSVDTESQCLETPIAIFKVSLDGLKIKKKKRIKLVLRHRELEKQSPH